MALISFDPETERKIAELKKLDPIRIFTKKLDLKVMNGEHEVGVRLFLPSGRTGDKRSAGGSRGVILFLHGGRWVTEGVHSYESICALMARETGMQVLAVEYRRAPEDRFPTALNDCYAAAMALYSGELVEGAGEENIVIMGDSAGGNLAAALVLMARDRGEFSPRKQILIYPALWNDYTDSSPFPSVKENGEGHMLTAAKMEEYLGLYEKNGEDRKNPYFAPLLETDLKGLPDTLILTAELDPLRDEGEEYARRLSAAGSNVVCHRIKKAFHGYFALGIKHMFVGESLGYIKDFIK